MPTRQHWQRLNDYYCTRRDSRFGHRQQAIGFQRSALYRLSYDNICRPACLQEKERSLINDFFESDARVIVIKPNKSSTWRANLYALIAISIPSLGAGIGFALLGAWPILPFAGLELIALGAALYYVNWNLEYRQVVTVSERNVKIEKGYFIPKRSWLWEREDTAVNVINAKNQWEGPSLWLHNRESRTSLGEFLSKEEAEDLLKRLRAHLPVRTYGSERNVTL